MSRRATAEEFSTIGVILLFFGISWVAYAYMQPLVFGCPPAGSSSGILPPCYSFSPTATVFYILGAISMLAGVVLLYIRYEIWQRHRRQETSTRADAPTHTGEGATQEARNA